MKNQLSAAEQKELHKGLEEGTKNITAPDRPDYLSAEAKKEWDRVVPALLMLGWISALDLMALSSYCEAYADWVIFRQRIAEENEKLAGAGDVQTFKTGAKQISVWRQLANDAEKRANAAGALFGFSPMARRNLKANLPLQPELFGNEERDAAEQYFSH
ncbi:MAG: phage terminase small subunit P27 family [Burkholderiaceae bacterium]|nr:phage terminase small subunit P27 family [Burkholderiaceae bacterium]